MQNIDRVKQNVDKLSKLELITVLNNIGEPVNDSDDEDILKDILLYNFEQGIISDVVIENILKKNLTI